MIIPRAAPGDRVSPPHDEILHWLSLLRVLIQSTRHYWRYDRRLSGSKTKAMNETRHFIPKPKPKYLPYRPAGQGHQHLKQEPTSPDRDAAIFETCQFVTLRHILQPICLPREQLC